MEKTDKFLLEGANKWMYEDGGTDKWVNEEPVIDGEEEIETPVEESELFSLAEDLVSGVTYEQLINTIEANESVKDEDAVNKVFEETLKSVEESARENFELNKDKIMNALTGGEESDEETIED